MHCRSLIGAIAVAAVMIPIGAQAADDAKYPDWKGAWARFVVPRARRPAFVRPDQAMGIRPGSPADGGVSRRSWRRASRTRPRAARAILSTTPVACRPACR